MASWRLICICFHTSARPAPSAGGLLTPGNMHGRPRPPKDQPEDPEKKKIAAKRVRQQCFAVCLARLRLECFLMLCNIIWRASGLRDVECAVRCRGWSANRRTCPPHRSSPSARACATRCWSGARRAAMMLSRWRLPAPCWSRIPKHIPRGTFEERRCKQCCRCVRLTAPLCS